MRSFNPTAFPMRTPSADDNALAGITRIITRQSRSLALHRTLTVLVLLAMVATLANFNHSFASTASTGAPFPDWSLSASSSLLQPQQPQQLQQQLQQRPGDSRTFPETGKSVRGRFLQYWDENGGLAQQGYPISEEMQETSDTDGKTYTVQYFERAVFELHPENTAPNDVLLSLLGNFLYRQKYPGAPGAPGQQANNQSGSVLFSQTGHHLGGLFLQYWQQHGGLAQQGYPISEEFTERSDLDGKQYLVQYFERAVFEAHPENQPPYDVLLSQLGTFRYRLKYGSGGSAGSGAPPEATPAATLPDMPNKPVVPLNMFKGCPSIGDGGDPDLNVRKDRTDSASYWYPVTPGGILSLTWPHGVEYRNRSNWSAQDTAAIARYEGIPVEVEGYLADAKQQGPESCNCHSVPDEDYHLWLVDDAGQDRSVSIVSEVTPRVRAEHQGWSLSNISNLVSAHTRVRLSGWLMLDPEHPDQVGQTRGSIWEIHPIIGFEVAQGGSGGSSSWVSLDTYTGGGIPNPATPTSPTSPNQPTQPVPPLPTQPAPPSGEYQASATVSNPTPPRNSNETVTGILTRGGQPVAGATMNTSWHYKTVTSSCSGTTDSNGVATCTRDVGGASLGYTVVIDVVFIAPDGQSVSTSTSFTPR